MLKKTLFFVHIPKTGGTSLRKAIEEKVGEENSFYDYGPHSEVTSPLILEQRYKKNSVLGIEECLENLSEEWSLICGHTRASIYSSIIDPCNIITFMRNPIDRVVSHYEHLRRHNDYKESLIEFCEKPHFQNIQSKSLMGYPLELIGFVGITDYFKKSVDIFKTQYQLEIEALELNQNERKKIKNNYELDKKTIRLIQKNNQEDILLYEKAKKLFETKYLLRNEQAFDTYGKVDLLKKNSVHGWFFTKTNEKTVEVLVNEEVIGITRTTTLRPTLMRLNAHNNGIVGFKYRFQKPLKESDNIRCRQKGKKYLLPGLNKITDENES